MHVLLPPGATVDAAAPSKNNPPRPPLTRAHLDQLLVYARERNIPANSDGFFVIEQRGDRTLFWPLTTPAGHVKQSRKRAWCGAKVPSRLLRQLPEALPCPLCARALYAFHVVIR